MELVKWKNFGGLLFRLTYSKHERNDKDDKLYAAHPSI